MEASVVSHIDPNTLRDLKKLLWGNKLQNEVFSRWTQGFIFSPDEPTAIVQLEGGPCAVIAPVQAFIVKSALFSSDEKEDLRNASNEDVTRLFYEALASILVQMQSDSFTIVCLEDSLQGMSNSSQTSSAPTTSPFSNTDPPSSDSTIIPTTSQQLTDKNGTNNVKIVDVEKFHSLLRCIKCKDETTMRAVLRKHIQVFLHDYGVLLYLYSLLLSKGMDQIKNEVEDSSEPLIDGTYGHGSQSLINLMVTGRAVSNVWDNDKEVSGLKLPGIHRQATIGFLTLLEHLRYCEVGWFLKNPLFPIWMLGSETHLTVLFSEDRSLVMTESPAQNAKNVFNRFDPEGNGFISSSLLGDVLSELDLVSEREYVDIMISKMDAEELGIITLNSFMSEFFPESTRSNTAAPFHLFHYNGLARSCPNNKVRYTEAIAHLEEEIDTQIITDSSPMKLCLQTKWPSIELSWENDVIPSLN